MTLIQALEEHFTAIQNPYIAPQMKAYMRNLFPFLGIKKPERAQVQKLCFREYPLTTEKELVSALLTLWEKPEREYQMVALELAYHYRKLWTPSFITTVEKLIRTKSWWDTVDALASKMVGTLLLNYPELMGLMDDWIEDKDFWLRRSALIYQLSYKEKTDHKRLFRYCEKTLHEEEFFIRKAIGWALRQYARTEPDSVRSFIQKHKTVMSPLSYKEAGKHCLQ